ncbi:hypothetical protein P9112_010783 [Eukaryota sp. TZLM1-RC]
MGRKKPSIQTFSDVSTLEDAQVKDDTSKIIVKSNKLTSLNLTKPNITYIDVSSCSLTSFTFPSSLRVFKASHNSLQTIPVIPKSLFSLICDHNQLSRVDFSGSKHCDLQTLILSHNKFTSMDLPKFHKLSKVSVGHNLLSSFSCAPLLSLKELRLANNQLKEIPSCLSKCCSLQILCLRNNLINHFDFNPITPCPLSSLGLSGNPRSFELGEGLKDLVLEALPDLMRLDDKPMDSWKALEKPIDREPEIEHKKQENQIFSQKADESEKKKKEKVGKNEGKGEPPLKIPRKESQLNKQSIDESDKAEQSKTREGQTVSSAVRQLEEVSKVELELGEWSD